MRTYKSYRKNEVIFREGDTENCMYVVTLGKVGVYSDYNTENEKLLTTLGYDRLFGEMAVIEGKPRSATVVALEDTKVRVITEAELDDYLRESPEKILHLMQATSARLRALSNDYVDACRTVDEYVAAEQKGGTIPAELTAKMKKYASGAKRK